ncbi:unnamed protein product [Clavelina lepadiformis]|uniref:Uncharacterized protein n=1 Tax=Clavelina lepadiformis TaxID=159417 RepID=A0ABP0FEI6_CLALP
MVIFSGCGAAMSGLCTWIIPAIGRRWFMGLVGVCHITYYMVSLFWLPNPESTWLVYFIGALGGIGELTLVNLYQGSVSLYFKDRLGIAYSTQNCVTNLGISFITGWSTSLCVYSKIYIQIGVMCLSLVCIGCAEVLFDRYDKQKTKTRLLAVKQKSNIATCPT